jgi:AbrB family looped-hinge helix DNA binding protein
VTSKGQVTIPIEVRQRLGIEPESEVEIEVVGDVAQIRKVTADVTRGERVVARLRGTATTRLSTDELMALTRGD